jgi:UDP-hydrolysing UDP-N-acetyl-D-glucosamine 2-epimerase
VITGARADYGLLEPLMRRIEAAPDLELTVIATCMHLSPAFGETVRLIEADGFTVDERVEMLLSSDTELGTAKSTGLGVISIAEALSRLRPDAVVILGDRFEALAAATAAFLLRIPIAHIHGGELTEGALDDGMRHAITKLALLHFTSTEQYRRRVIQLGEQPDRVFSTGALGIDNAMSATRVDRSDLSRDLEITLEDPIVVVTFHPVTIESGSEAGQVAELLSALDSMALGTIVITRPNADPGNRAINDLVDEYTSRAANAVAFDALGHVRYLSLVREASAVVGNSSSGIIEAPALGTPSVNIGTRQDGRIRPTSVIDCAPVAADISAALALALDPAHQARARETASAGPYGDGRAAERIVGVLRSADLLPEALRKRFFDLPEAFD